MKFLIYLSLILLPLSLSARDPGTGSNTTVGPGPAAPGSAPGSTSIMGGGTPGNAGINVLGIDEPTKEELEIMYQEQEEKKDEKKKDKKVKE